MAGQPYPDNFGLSYWVRLQQLQEYHYPYMAGSSLTQIILGCLITGYGCWHIRIVGIAAPRVSLSVYMAGSSLTQIILGCLTWVRLQQLQEYHYPLAGSSLTQIILGCLTIRLYGYSSTQIILGCLNWVISVYMAGSSLTQIILGCLTWVRLQQLQEYHYPFIWLAAALPR